MHRQRLPQLLSDAKRAGWGPYIRTASDEAALLEGCTLNFREANKVLWFAAKRLRHSKGEWAGRPILFTEWQRDRLIIPAFGWYRPDGRRRINLIQCWIAKKNGKSTLASVFAAVGLLLDKEPGAEVYCAATEKKQASIVFGEVERMIRMSPALLRRVRIYRGTKTILRDDASWLRALPCNDISTDGLNSSMVIVDELHAFGSKAFIVYQSLRQSGAARRNPLTVVISHAGRSPTQPAYEEFKDAERVEKGEVIDTGMLPVIYQTDPDDDVGAEETWKKANPSLGVTMRLSSMRETWERMKRSERTRREFEQFRLNRWVNAETSWLDAYRWLQLRGETPDGPRDGILWIMGLDLSSTTDLTAAALVGRDFKNNRYLFKTKYFLPDYQIDAKEARDNMPYQMHAEAGWCILTKGRVVDYTVLEDWIVKTWAQFGVQEIAFDQWGATQMVQRLMNVHGMTCVRVEQRIEILSPPSKELERCHQQGSMIQDGNPITLDHIARARVYTNASGLIRPVKGGPHRTVSKIDGVISMITGLARSMALLDPNEYADCGVTAICPTPSKSQVQS